jgi:hypothetical protein
MDGITVSGSVAFSTAMESKTTPGQCYTVVLSGTGSAFIYLQGSNDGVSFYDLPNDGKTVKKYILTGETATFSLIENLFSFTRLKVEKISGTPVVDGWLTIVGC